MNLFYGFGVPNASFETLQQEWIQLSPYGEFPHTMGLQVVNRTSASAMASNFNSMLGKLKRAFGGCPFYIGHPDLPGSANAGEDRAYGWIEELQARDDGFYGRVKWTESGKKLIADGDYKFYSPFWQCRQTGSANGRKILSPERLISAGLTNNPNIPVLALSNCKCQESASSTSTTKTTMLTPEELRRRLANVLALPDDADDTAINAAWTELQKDPAANTVVALRTKATDATAKVTASEISRDAAAKERDELKTANAALFAERAVFLSNSAVADGRITVAEAAEYQSRLADPAQFAAANSALKAAAPKVHTQSVTSNLGNRKAEVGAGIDRQAKVAGLVNARMKETGEDYGQAFTAVRAANSGLFAQMQQPQSAAA
ncbi:MAG TPA: phage protease [Candidatus Methylacidiphilales bacterium]|nr:phage protease [Candidatus Methylacidiphilales bacterium]